MIKYITTYQGYKTDITYEGHVTLTCCVQCSNEYLCNYIFLRKLLFLLFVVTKVKYPISLPFHYSY